MGFEKNYHFVPGRFVTEKGQIFLSIGIVTILFKIFRKENNKAIEQRKVL
jgi:hypothetical protein